MTEKEYYNWEATTASTLYRINGIENGRARRLADRIEKTLRPYETKARSADNCPTFTSVVEAAAKLDAELCQCRAKYVVFMYERAETNWFTPPSPSRWGYPVDANGMENALGGPFSSERRMVVDLVVSPCLVKYGDSAGEGYEMGRWISKMQVVPSYARGP
jgi:hypothetical protein